MFKKKIIIISLVITMIVSLIGCNNNINREAGKETQETSTVTDDKGYMDKSLSTKKRVELLISEMSLEEKVGQMMQGSRDVVSGDDLKDLGLGSVLSGGGSYPGNNTMKDWNDMFIDYQDSAMSSKHKIPILYGVDAVHGLALIPGAVVYPHNIGLGAANDPELTYQMGAAVAEEMKLVNILWNFSPCVAVNTDPRWGRTYECFSSDPAIVTSLSDAYLKGQSDQGVAATAKHYIADGGTKFGTGEGNFLIDRGDVVITEEVLRTIHLKPYEQLIQSGVKIIMASFSSYNGLKMHENKYLLTDVLKNELGFQGFVVSDWEAINGLSGSSFEEKMIKAVNAGVDMFMEPFNYKEGINAIINGVNNKEIGTERIDDAVSRILTVKFDMGLFEDPYMEQSTHQIEDLGNEEYRNLARQLVEKSLVLLKNENKILPLKRNQKIFVTGPAIDDMGLQCGGWGLTWQGNMDNGGKKVTEGATILEGLRKYAEKYNLEIITEKDRAKEADIVILAVGEVPYAEFEGDTDDLSITGAKGHPDNLEAIEYAKALNKPVLTLIVAGRNVIINEYMEDWDGIVMCYLPGSEGEGVASVLTGESSFTGKLPMPYYKNTTDIGKEDPDLLYAPGYGLSYE
ncbi:beta-glucosidase [Mobilisporobacter senegalensis]|uniref:beta-glucosidase n=1 Tax=Mobilisporobacter senegalensis TaxID=1329262 RepID=A0A3N1XGE9_9FIRM|nr:glycoside hydrolase family 3 protein [Mobilisporobacter senegalensis]ROR23887.1 beta-glucosidase [Mobilisporobacter senegalensis]